MTQLTTFLSSFDMSLLDLVPYQETTAIIDIWQLKLHHLESSEGEKQHSTTGCFLFLYFFLFPSSEMSLQKQPDQGMLLC